MNNKIEKKDIYGAKWWKVDFHLHTPASGGCYKKDELDILPRDFLLKAMGKKIDCLVITDHESCGWIQSLQDAYNDLKSENPKNINFREIFIFPGFEYGKAAPSAHLLCIFDVGTSEAKIYTTMGELNKKSFSECIKIIGKKGGIAIPAHVENEKKGILKKLKNEETLTSDLISNYIQGEFIAIEAEDYNTKLPQMFINNKVKLSKVIGSDSHELSTIGDKYTWVKMQTPNIAAMKLALFDGDDGILRYDRETCNPNLLSNKRYIKSISISNAKKAGNGELLTIEFSPWLNTIIGGRGSGKSSILNFLRVGLSQIDDMDEQTQLEFNKFNKISNDRNDKEGMLKENTEITTIISEGGIDYKLSYTQGKGIKEAIMQKDGSWTVTYEDIANNNHPVAIFNQKQVYNMAMDQDAICNIIDDMCDLSKVKENIDEEIEEYLKVSRDIRKLDEEIEEEKILNRNLTTNKTKLKAVEDSSINDLLKKLNYASTFKGEVDKTKETLKNQQTYFEEIKLKCVDVRFTPDISSEFYSSDYQETTGAITKLLDSYNLNKQRIISEIDTAITKCKDFTRTLEGITFITLYNEMKSDYEIELEKLKLQGIEMDNMEELIQNNQEILRKIETIGEEKEKRAGLLQQKKEMFQNITEGILSINSTRKDKISELNKSNNFLDIELIEYGNATDSEDEFRKAINKSDRFNEQILNFSNNEKPTGILYEICSGVDKEERLSKRNKFINNIIDMCNTGKDFEFNQRFKKHLKNNFEFNKEQLEMLRFWYPKNKLELTLVTDGSRTPVSSGSAGQRVAGMLSFLMTINDKPIIVDQPEDDLDTKLISSSVVSKLKELKISQQIIVVTHNPNIPVNAAAENIISMNFAKGQIRRKNSGALQLKEIREDICSIMEGGKTALDNRYFRVSKALNKQERVQR